MLRLLLRWLGHGGRDNPHGPVGPEAPVAVFVDTNAFLHYPPVENIDWKTLCSASAATLCVCITVIHELDEKKSHPLLAQRAERVIGEALGEPRVVL